MAELRIRYTQVSQAIYNHPAIAKMGPKTEEQSRAMAATDAPDFSRSGM